jgi:hypothetical protein
MNASSDGADGRGDGGSSRAAHSARVRLEVAFLDADEAPPTPAPFAAHDERPRLTALVVAAEADVRRYVRECLRERADVRLLEAGTAAAAIALADSCAPDFVIVDESQRGMLSTQALVRAIVIVDDVPHDASSSVTRVRLLTRPFTAEGLLAEVRELLR